RRGRPHADDADAALGESFLAQHPGDFRAAEADAPVADPGLDAARRAFQHAGHAPGGKREQDRFAFERQHHVRIEEIVDEVALEAFAALEAADHDGVDCARAHDPAQAAPAPVALLQAQDWPASALSCHSTSTCGLI